MTDVDRDSRVCLFTRDLHADGAPRFTLDLAKELSLHVGVDLMALKRQGPLIEYSPPNVRFFDLKLDGFSWVRPAFGATTSCPDI
jgi:hypothetical protein